MNNKNLQEQLDGAGVDLPSLYKRIEGQIPDRCRTEAWKKRAHWVGSRATGEVDESVKIAEEYLQTCRPVRRLAMLRLLVCSVLYALVICS